jgi:hypothetical protein
MTCPDCEHHKQRAALWRHEAYRLAGTPLPWDADEAIAKAVAAERERIIAANASEIERLNAYIKTLEESRNVALAEAYRCGWDGGVKREREECARACDSKVYAEYATGKVDHNEIGWTQACSIAIRARGKE